MENILIVGAGQFGAHIAHTMNLLKCNIMAVDNNEERISKILPDVTDAQIGDSTDASFMQSLGIDNYDVCIVTIGENFQNSLETTALLKELGAQYVVSRAVNDVQEKFLLRNGADEVVYPEKQTAIRIATRFSSNTILDFIQLDKNYAIYEVAVPKGWYGKTIAGLDIRKQYNINIISMKQNDIVHVPMPDTVISEGDTMFVIGEKKDIYKAFRI